jgi:hypothetical protein
MRVTESMTIESGAPLSELADFIGLDDVGVQVTADFFGCVKIKVDSTAYPSKVIRLEPDDADALADLIKRKAAEARDGS